MASTADIRAALHARYDGEAWALLWEVPDGTGSNKSRTADALAMSLWPSRGLLLHGHELKASRTDWLKELSQPSKAESICRYCDHWWIVAGDKGIVRDGELPPTWGLMVLKGGKLIQEVAAPKLEPLPVDRAFLCGILRAQTRAASKEDGKILRAEFDRGYATGQKQANRGESHYKEALDKLTASVRAFQEESGLTVSTYGHDQAMAKLVKSVVSGERCSVEARHRAGDIYRAAKGMLSILEQHGLMPTNHEPRN